MYGDWEDMARQLVNLITFLKNTSLMWVLLGFVWLVSNFVTVKLNRATDCYIRQLFGSLL